MYMRRVPNFMTLLFVVVAPVVDQHHIAQMKRKKNILACQRSDPNEAYFLLRERYIQIWKTMRMTYNDYVC